MRRQVIVATLAIVLGAFLVPATPAAAQTTATDAKQKASDAADKIKGYSVDKKNDAVAYGKKLVADLDVKIKELEARIAKDTSAAKADLQRQLGELKAKRAQAAKKLDELGKASAESWDGVKTGFADAYKDLHRAYDNAVASFRK